MNAAQANALPMPEILRTLGHQPQRERGHDLCYFSPFRDERTPSFHVSVSGNVWYDFGAGRGGTAGPSGQGGAARSARGLLLPAPGRDTARQPGRDNLHGGVGLRRWG